jgi:predicted DNA-binding transcriptional regulator YafY
MSLPTLTQALADFLVVEVSKLMVSNARAHELSGDSVIADMVGLQGLEIRYAKAGQDAEPRMIVPFSWAHTAGSDAKTNIRAYCFLRGEPRTFRIDRIESVEDFNPPENVGSFVVR